MCLCVRVCEREKERQRRGPRGKKRGGGLVGLGILGKQQNSNHSQFNWKSQILPVAKNFGLLF